MKFLPYALCALILMSLSGCNTLKGMGQDLQKAGEKLENALKK